MKDYARRLVLVDWAARRRRDATIAHGYAVCLLGLMLLLGGVSLLLSACAGPYDAAVKSVRTLQHARSLAGKQLAASAQAAHQRCLAKHGSKTAAYATCIKTHREALQHWQQIVRPALDSAAAAGEAAIKTSALVERCKTEKNCAAVVLDIMRPGICAVTRGLKLWGHLLSDGATALLSIVASFQGVICAK